jgi:hypothetical protein
MAFPQQEQSSLYKLFRVVQGLIGAIRDIWPSVRSRPAATSAKGSSVAEMLDGLIGLKISEGAIRQHAGASCQAVCRMRRGHPRDLRNSQVIAQRTRLRPVSKERRADNGYSAQRRPSLT